MSRIARIVAPLYPHHIVIRGNNQKKIFFRSKDNKEYLRIVKNCSKKWKCRILSYCLMPNHVHLLLVPQKKESLSKTMQAINLTYTQYLNKRYDRSGRTWESRYHSSIIHEDQYLWRVIRYIETNPVRANLVKDTQDYIWSSAYLRIHNIKNNLIESLESLIKRYGVFGSTNYRDYLKFPEADRDSSQHRIKELFHNNPSLGKFK